MRKEVGRRRKAEGWNFGPLLGVSALGETTLVNKEQERRFDKGNSAAVVEEAGDGGKGLRRWGARPRSRRREGTYNALARGFSGERDARKTRADKKNEGG